MGIVANGIQSADDTAYGCAGNDIDGDARLLQHFQHTDMRHTLCAAATEYDADFLPLRLYILFLLLCTCYTAHQYTG